MSNSKKVYYYMDIELTTMTIREWGISQTATHTGETDHPDVHRVFIPKGQYNKLVRKLDK